MIIAQILLFAPLIKMVLLYLVVRYGLVVLVKMIRNQTIPTYCVVLFSVGITCLTTLLYWIPACP
jgi:hypothetical protein